MKTYCLVTLHGDLDAGEGTIHRARNWKKLPPLLRADLLKDWLHEIEAEYAAARNELREEWDAVAQRRDKP